MEKIPRGSTRNCTPPPAKKDATSFKEMQTRSCLQVLSGGPLRGQLFTIYRKFALCFQWRDPLPAHPDCDFVNELFHDINFGVRIGFNHDRIPCFPQITLPQPLCALRTGTGTRNVPEQKGRAFPCTYVFESCLVSDGCYSEKALAASKIAYH